MTEDESSSYIGIDAMYMYLEIEMIQRMESRVDG